jgi:broad specificity phosphatase PhoE
MQHLYLMRHGQSQANAHHIVAGSHESPLSEVGRLQAAFAGDTAKQFFHFGLIVTSPMGRAMETAHIVASRIGYPQENIVVLPELRERNLGNVEGATYARAPQHNGNYEDAENVPGVEPIGDLCARMQDVLRQLRERPEQHILVIAHNGCGRMLKVALRNGQPMDMYKEPRTENAVIYQLT